MMVQIINRNEHHGEFGLHSLTFAVIKTLLKLFQS